MPQVCAFLQFLAKVLVPNQDIDGELLHLIFVRGWQPLEFVGVNLQHVLEKGETKEVWTELVHVRNMDLKTMAELPFPLVKNRLKAHGPRTNPSGAPNV